MAAYPVITDGESAVDITTNSSSLPYSMLIATLNDTSYKVNRVYIEASSLIQAGTQFEYNTVRPDGKRFVISFSQNADPYQFLPVFNSKVENENYVLDNMSVVSFTLQPNAYIQMYFWTEAVSVNNYLPGVEDSIEPDSKILMTVQNTGSHKKDIAKILAVSLLTGLVLIFLLKDE